MASAATKISFTCPNCAKVLRSSTRPPKGKKIKCPACREAFMPELDDEEAATAIQSTPSVKGKAKAPSRDEEDDEDVRPRSKKRRADDEDDDDDAGPPRSKRRRDDDEDEDDDRPIKKKKKAKKKSGGGMLMILGIVFLGGGALLSCGLCGVGAFVWPGFLTSKTNLEAFVPPNANIVMGGNPKLMKAKAPELEKILLQAAGPMQKGVQREDIAMNSDNLLMFGNTQDFDMKLTAVFASNAADIEKVKRNPALGAAQTLGGHANVHKSANRAEIPFDFVAFLPNNIVVMGNGDQQSFIATLDRGKKAAQPNAALELSRSIDRSQFWIAVAADAKIREDLKGKMTAKGLMPIPAAVANAAGAVDGVKGVTVTIEVAENQDVKIAASVPCKNADDAGKIKAAAEESWNQVKAFLQLGMMFQQPGQKQVPQAFVNDLTSIQFANEGVNATARMKLTKQAVQELVELGAQKNNLPGPAPFPQPPGPFPQPPGPMPPFPPPGPFPQPGVGPDVTPPPGAKFVNTFKHVNLQINDQRDNTFQFTKGKRITVTMVSTTADQFIDVDLFVLQGNVGEGFPLASDQSVGPNGRVSFVVPATGFYRIRVKNLGPGMASSCVVNIYEQ